MVFRNVKKEELSQVSALYKSVIGHGSCAWNEFYPGPKELQHDFETNNLFVLLVNDVIIGAASIVPENEMSEFPCWKINDGTVREIARIVIALSEQGNGLAYSMVREIINKLKNQGCRAIHLSAAETNIPALKVYLKLGFKKMGEKDMYGAHYILLEKILEPPY